MGKLIGLMALILVIGNNGWSQIVNNGPPKPVLGDTALLKHVNAQILYEDATLGISYAMLPYAAEYKLSQTVHSMGRCGGFESLENKNLDLNKVKASLMQVRSFYGRSRSYHAMARPPRGFAPRPMINDALNDLKAENLKQWVTWMSSFPTRYNRAADPNIHVRALYDKLGVILKASGRAARVDLIDHTSTKQKSIRVRVEGSSAPNELVVFGAHYDSISLFGSGNAPGADDDASGSANLLEVLRVLLAQPQTARTVEFFWYAGEESGLLGSAEIAEKYKETKQNVISVIQLDMTLFPGSGSGTMAFMQDFTSPWLNDVMKALNETYIKARVIEDRCGYGCSDHASWHRRGFPTAMPSESTMREMNKNIHSPKDLIDGRSDFNHSLNYAKLALAVALELGNSNQKQPF